MSKENDEDLLIKYYTDKFRLLEQANVGDITIPKNSLVKILDKFSNTVLVEVLSMDMQAVIPIDKLTVVDKPTFSYDFSYLKNEKELKLKTKNLRKVAEDLSKALKDLGVKLQILCYPDEEDNK